MIVARLREKERGEKIIFKRMEKERDGVVKLSALAHIFDYFYRTVHFERYV